MSASAISSVSVEAQPLVKMANGEFSAEAVAARPMQAAHLVKLKDGNYSEPIVAAEDRYTATGTDLSVLQEGR